MGVGGHDINSDSVVDWCALVGGINVKAKSIGWLLGGGLGELKEVGRTNYHSGEIRKKRRKLKPKGGEAKRKSRRVVGECVVNEILETLSKSLRNFLMKGGRGGLIQEGLTTEWNYFPSEKN